MAAPDIEAMVAEFVMTTHQDITRELSILLVEEELDEFSETTPGTEDDLKELCDLIYVLFGYAVVNGYKINEAMKRLHENNLARVIQDDGSVLFNEKGKVLKNPNHEKIKLKDLI